MTTNMILELYQRLTSFIIFKMILILLINMKKTIICIHGIHFHSTVDLSVYKSRDVPMFEV